MKNIFSTLNISMLLASAFLLAGTAEASSVYRQPIRVDNLYGPRGTVQRTARSAHTQPITQSMTLLQRRTRSAERLSARTLQRKYLRKNLENRNLREEQALRLGVEQRRETRLKQRQERLAN